MWLCIREFLLDPDKTVYWFPASYVSFVVIAGYVVLSGCRTKD